MSVHPFEWDNAEWAIVENKYGKLLTYNLPRFNRGYANLNYQGYITKMLESGLYTIFYDVGAYIGLFSQVASKHCLVVHAYEAHPFYFGILLTNMRFLHNVFCHYNFVTNSMDYIRKSPTIEEDIKGLVVKGKGEPYNINMTSLDEQISPDAKTYILIKLDVEGNELNILKGSEDLLKNPKIHWIIDVHTQRGITSEDVLSYFPNRKITMISHKVIKVEGLE